MVWFGIRYGMVWYQVRYGLAKQQEGPIKVRVYVMPCFTWYIFFNSVQSKDFVKLFDKFPTPGLYNYQNLWLNQFFKNHVAK